MDGFKNSTKTQYMKGGACEGYAKGGSVKGAAKISKVMGEFKAGTLHSGSKSGPEVTSKKQATAIALSEARKAGAKMPVKKFDGGGVFNERGKRATRDEVAAEGRRVENEMAARAAARRPVEGISTRPTDNSGRRMTNEELGMTPGGVDRAKKKAPSAVKNAAGEAAKGAAARAARPLPKKAMPVAPREPLISPSLMREINMRSMVEKYATPANQKRPATGLGSVTDSEMRMLRDASGYKKGGLSAMPKGKKC